MLCLLFIGVNIAMLIEFVINDSARKHRYGKNPAIPIPGTSLVRILSGYHCMHTPGVPVFRQKKKIRYRFGTGPVQDGIKLSQNGVVLGLNSNPIYLLHPILFSATRFSLFSTLDSLCLSLPHSTAGALGSLFLTSSLYR